MTQDEIIMRHRLNLLLYAKSIKNIPAACRQFSVSRTVYYKYRQRYLIYGIAGLKDRQKKIPVMPNATKANVVDKVLSIARRYTTYGPLRLANELGNIVCAATVYNILRRHGLSKKLDRLLSLADIPSDIKISSVLARKIEQAKPASIYSPRPEYMLSVDTFYVCRLKGVRRIYQFTAIDTNSSFRAAYLYADKTVDSAVDFIKRTIALFKALSIIIYSVLTDNGKEYTSYWKSYHIFEDYLAKESIKHRYTKVRCP